MPQNFLGYTVAADLLHYERMKAQRIVAFDNNVTGLVRQSERYAVRVLQANRIDKPLDTE